MNNILEKLHNMMKNKKIILSIIAILLLISCIIGISYAYYLSTISQSGTNIVDTDCFEITYEDNGEVILRDAFPIRDSEASSVAPYHFKLKNVCSLPANYQVNLEVLNTLISPDFNCSIAVFMASCVPSAAILEASYSSTAPFVKFPI